MPRKAFPNLLNIACLLTMSLSAEAATDQVKQLTDDGSKAILAGDYQTGITKLQQAHNIDPSYEAANQQLINAEAQLKKTIDQQEQSLPATDPHLSENLELYAKLLYKSGHMTEADSIYKRLNALKSNQAQSNSVHASATTRTSLSRDSKLGEYEPYMDKLQKQIKRAWFLPQGNPSKNTVVAFKVHSDGRMSHLRLKDSSGMILFDQAALRAVENSAPFDSLPNSQDESVDIDFTFKINGSVSQTHVRQF